MHHLVADLLDASVDNWYQDPDADMDLPYLRRYGRRAVQFLLSIPSYLVVRRSTSTSLVKCPNHNYYVFRNIDVDEAAAQQRLQSQPPPLPPPPWRQAQLDYLTQPPAPAPWSVPTWGASSSDPDREPILLDGVSSAGLCRVQKRSLAVLIPWVGSSQLALPFRWCKKKRESENGGRKKVSRGVSSSFEPSLCHHPLPRPLMEKIGCLLHH